MAIRKYNHQGVIHTLPTVKNGDMSTDKRSEPSIHSLLAPDVIAKSYFRLFLC